MATSVPRKESCGTVSKVVTKVLQAGSRKPGVQSSCRAASELSQQTSLTDISVRIAYLPWTEIVDRETCGAPNWRLWNVTPAHLGLSALCPTHLCPERMNPVSMATISRTRDSSSRQRHLRTKACAGWTSDQRPGPPRRYGLADVGCSLLATPQ